jgi:hypothetical protein
MDPVAERVELPQLPHHDGRVPEPGRDTPVAIGVLGQWTNIGRRDPRLLQLFLSLTPTRARGPRR